MSLNYVRPLKQGEFLSERAIFRSLSEHQCKTLIFQFSYMNKKIKNIHDPLTAACFRVRQLTLTLCVFLPQLPPEECCCFCCAGYMQPAGYAHVPLLPSLCLLRNACASCSVGTYRSTNSVLVSAILLLPSCVFLSASIMCHGHESYSAK